MYTTENPNTTRAKHRAKKRVDTAKADLAAATSPAVAQKVWKCVADAFIEAALLAEWKDRRAVIDFIIGLIQEAAISDEEAREANEALAADAPF